jgi:acetoin utilization protein AcuB
MAGEVLQVVGIVSDRDIARAYPANVNPFSPGAPQSKVPALSRPVEEIMKHPVLTVALLTPIEEAARIMRDKKIGALPVVDGERLVGIITESDIFRAFIEVVGTREPGVRVTFEYTAGADAIATVIALGKRHGLQVSSVLSMEHNAKRMGMARLAGQNTQKFVDDIWKSGHRVLSVLHDKQVQHA